MITFSSEKELYKKVKPALSMKVNEFKLYKIDITIKELWDFLVITKLNKKNNLKLCDIVSEIVSLNIDDYIVNKNNNKEEKINLEKELL